MTKVRININAIQRHFKGRPFISKGELYHYFRTGEPGLNESTLRWRIHRLKDQRILLPLKRGVYSLNIKPQFRPVPDKLIQKINSLAAEGFSPDFEYSIWSTEWLNQFTVHQSMNCMIILEAEKDWVQSLFRMLQAEHKNVFLDPDKEMIQNYVSVQNKAIIVKPLISRSPLQKVKNKIVIPTLEKILVDVFCEYDLFISYQGTELENIFTNARKSHALNLSALINYARRRKRADALLGFMKAIPDKELHKLLAV